MRESAITRGAGSSIYGKSELIHAMPPRKTSRKQLDARTKTDTGRQVEHTKAIEITLVKELGKLAS